MSEIPQEIINRAIVIANLIDETTPRGRVANLIAEAIWAERRMCAEAASQFINERFYGSRDRAETP